MSQFNQEYINKSVLEQAFEASSCTKTSVVLPTALTLIFLTFVAAFLTFIPLAVYKNFRKEQSVLEKKSLSYNYKKISELDYVSQLDVEAKRKLAAMVSYVSSEIIARNNKRIADPDKLAFQIVTESLIHDEDPFFVAALIYAESTFESHAKSNVGARGLMQLMPRTAEYVASVVNLEYDSVDALHNPDLNIRLGITYLKELKDTFRGDVRKTLIAYNWGPTNVLKGKKAPEMSEVYARKIAKYADRWSTDYKSKAEQFRYSNLATIMS